jgi:hypothetical protein
MIARSGNPELTQDIAHRLEKTVVPEIPFDRWPAIEAIGATGFFFDQWIEFLIRYKSRPALFVMFMGYGANAGEFFDPRFIEKKVRIIERWAERAKRDYVKHWLSLFENCQVLGPDKRPKHWPPGNTSNQELLRLSTKTKESIFFGRITRTDLQQGLWLAMAKFFPRFKNGTKRYFVVNFGAAIGVFKGKLCKRAKYDVSLKAQPYAHAYPIPDDAGKNLPTVTPSEFGLRLRLIADRDQ